ncbi:hypothetical protein L3Q82_003638 [Scortum barcoo]|uniref:Uncharacterized protein n=1 Tax=Scortum barcoo TaxID=214431 RepID=A0ACB8VN29_9TELE|nr:hypothetical protein L3Q82_003638 [Scortum barcoo]
MTTRKASSVVADTVTTTTTSSSSNIQQHLHSQPRSRSPGGAPASEAAGGGAEMFGEFQDWCLRTYGDSGKTKTVTRRKYNKILQTLLQGDEENSNGVFLQEKGGGGGHINAKFKFWVKSKGFQVGTLQDAKTGSSDRPVLYVPIKATKVMQSFFSFCGKTWRYPRQLKDKIADNWQSLTQLIFFPSSAYILTHTSGFKTKSILCAKLCFVLISRSQCVDSVSGVDSSLKRVAVVEDFFDIIYAMHVEISADPGKAPKHAGQKKTYKAIAETYAFLPREAVTRFLMSCGECQKRMHISTTGQDCKENDRPSSLVLEVIDYNMPLTTTYMKQMKLQCMGNNKCNLTLQHVSSCQPDKMDKQAVNQPDDSSLSSEEEAEMSEPAWLAADLGAASDLSPPSRGERMRHSPPNAHGKEDDDQKEWPIVSPPPPPPLPIIIIISQSSASCHKEHQGPRYVARIAQALRRAHPGARPGVGAAGERLVAGSLPTGPGRAQPRMATWARLPELTTRRKVHEGPVAVWFG